jgi:hypothetical protein
MSAPRRIRAAVLCFCCIASLSIAHATTAAGQIPPVAEIVQPVQGDSIPSLVTALWRGIDDSSIDHFRFAIDPPFFFGDTAWIDTQDSSRVLLLQSREFTQLAPNAVFSEFHILVVQAIDNDGLHSAPVSVGFKTWTYAPVTAIMMPLPSILETSINTGVSIYWQGEDMDGYFSQRPVFYRRRLLSQSSEFPIALAVANPDSFRRYSVQNGWTGWDTNAGDSISVHFTNLNPGGRYLFTVVAFDEVGAYDPVWSTSKNMLRMRVRAGVGVGDAPGVAALELAAPVPNPASISAALSFRLPRPGRATLEILDVSGRRVRALIDGVRAAGEQRAEWDLRDARGAPVRAGIYFVRVRAGAETRARRLLVAP